MTLARALIRVLRPLAPRAIRDRWVEEWLGEIEHSNAGLRFALGAIPDVVTLHRLPRAVVFERRSLVHGLRQDFRQDRVAHDGYRQVHDFLAITVHQAFEHGMPVPTAQRLDEVGVAFHRRALSGHRGR